MPNANPTLEKEIYTENSTRKNDHKTNFSTGEVGGGVLAKLSLAFASIPKFATLSEKLRKPLSLYSDSPQGSQRVSRKNSQQAPGMPEEHEESEDDALHERIRSSSRYDTVEDHSVPFVFLLPSDRASLLSSMDLSSPWDAVSKNEGYESSS
eukprot:CAMPEP_0184706720 /NCGR_PEP_ID=MMETSP0313-20130426/36904_1 /TAXON_ID=2792 /ORGANISM="Porphyridium aerugineum, Strain SAG 1380-2" /LENGTH=151 /DNA_ID=CAMNT_0027168281 /DNA_START=539 /DNA_END=991 /DNA_ORIENTATION=-